ncbi:MAG: hydroxymethylglutaryl-CoA lyase [Crocinitomicaceae bacterium]|nr:hydroxymethylglutaryl-CoA lyase [Crocinitomicaceae bacterium]|tara:strand:- start:340 stop:1188 length:849 start_codon:yes stop_codon:yes gene_type:complete
MKIVECPRDAMQGIKHWIPSELKIKYINQLLNVGFDTLDFGSFVSPKAIPQLKDTEQVLNGLDLSDTKSKLLAIVANERGALDACRFEEIQFLGYPFSISEEFQKRNTNASIEESLSRVEAIQNLCLKHKKELVIYISMGFGNPYGEQWSPDIAAHWSNRLATELDVKILALSDTIGVSNPENISSLFSTLIPEFPKVEFGAHLHSIPETRMEKIEAAYSSGCKRFDGAIKGHGGCPMAADDLVGNMATEDLLDFASQHNIQLGLDLDALASATAISNEVFL